MRDFEQQNPRSCDLVDSDEDEDDVHNILKRKIKNKAGHAKSKRAKERSDKIFISPSIYRMRSRSCKAEDVMTALMTRGPRGPEVRRKISIKGIEAEHNC